jgi:hypothetical protein
MTTRELIAELRSRINPLYADQRGTIDQLLAELTTELDKVRKPIAWRYTDSWGTHFTEDHRDVYDSPGVETWTALYGDE